MLASWMMVEWAKLQYIQLLYVFIRTVKKFKSWTLERGYLLGLGRAARGRGGAAGWEGDWGFGGGAQDAQDFIF